MTATRDDKCKGGRQFKKQIRDLVDSRNKQVISAVNNYFDAEKQYEGIPSVLTAEEQESAN